MSLITSSYREDTGADWILSWRRIIELRESERERCTLRIRSGDAQWNCSQWASSFPSIPTTPTNGARGSGCMAGCCSIPHTLDRNIWLPVSGPLRRVRSLNQLLHWLGSRVRRGERLSKLAYMLFRTFGIVSVNRGFR